MQELLRKLLPILLLLLIGFFAKKKKLFTDSFIEGLKVLILNIALPMVLFDSFSSMTLQVSYLLLFVLVLTQKASSHSVFVAPIVLLYE